jgi:hypothetical protein
VLGVRKYPDEDGHLRLAPGEYGYHPEDGCWHARPPTDKPYMTGNLRRHSVVEHPDGTITVTPSILITYEFGDRREKVEWHGFLERGVWREC